MGLVDTLLEQLPRAHIILVAILPCGDAAHMQTLFNWPNALTPGIDSANEWCGLQTSDKPVRPA